MNQEEEEEPPSGMGPPPQQPAGWSAADIEQVFSMYDRNQDGLLELNDLLDILVNEMGYADDEMLDGVGDGFMREFGEQVEQDQGDGQYISVYVLDLAHWAVLCNHIHQNTTHLQEGAEGGDTSPRDERTRLLSSAREQLLLQQGQQEGGWDQEAPAMPRESQAEGDGDYNYNTHDSAYDLESGGGADPAELAQLRNEVAMLRSKNGELTKRVLNQQKEIIVFFVLLFVALVFVVIALFTDLIRSD
jgi:hypothetical protein